LCSCAFPRLIKQKVQQLKDHERDVLRRTILELVKKGHVHYTDIEKKACATCLSFATSNTVRRQFYHYLLPNRYIERVNRGVYIITARGEKLLEILN
jgi:predicted transcriptional regulator